MCFFCLYFPFWNAWQFWACSPSFSIFTCVCFSTNSGSYRSKCYNSSTLLLKNCETQDFHVTPQTQGSCHHFGMRLPCDHGITSQSLPWSQCGSMWIYCTHTSPLGQLRATRGLAPLAKGVPGDALHYHSINFHMTTRRQPDHGSALCTEGLPLPLEQSAVCSNTCCKRMHQWLRCYKNVKAALA